MVKTYIKARFNIDQSNKDGEKVAKSLATISPIRSTTNPFAAQSPVAVKASSNISSFDRHRSPDPPPRSQRGNQSPLIIRRRLEAASPILQRR